MPKKPLQKNHLELYERILLIRRVEEKIAELYPEQEMKCPVHLSIGQEAIAAAIGQALTSEDYVFSTHRCHSHYLAKGGDIRAMFAELYGKATGCAKGKGGSMHLVDAAQGMMGASAIVGGTIPLGVGAALSAKFEGKGRVAAAFFGDAASEEGVFQESLNFAALHKLPMIFVCENNFFATATPMKDRQPIQNISNRGEIYGVPGVLVDGTDPWSVFQKVEEQVKQMREGSGPVLIECRAYRWKEHVGPNEDYNLGFRSKEELDEWKAKCPVEHLKRDLVAGGASENQLEDIRVKIDHRIEDAVKFAKESPFPEASELLTEIL